MAIKDLLKTQITQTLPIVSFPAIQLSLKCLVVSFSNWNVSYCPLSSALRDLQKSLLLTVNSSGGSNSSSIGGGCNSNNHHNHNHRKGTGNGNISGGGAATTVAGSGSIIFGKRYREIICDSEKLKKLNAVQCLREIVSNEVEVSVAFNTTLLTSSCDSSGGRWSGGSGRETDEVAEIITPSMR